MGKQVTLDLRHGVHGDAHHNQERCPAEVKRHRSIGDQDLRQDADNGEISGADHGDAREHIIDVLRRTLARSDTGNEAAVLLQVLRRFRRVEHDRRVEESEEDDESDVEDQEQRPSVTELGGDSDEPVRSLTGIEVGDGGRQQQ